MSTKTSRSQFRVRDVMMLTGDADVILMEEDLWKLVSAIDISKKALNLVRQNYAIISGLNTLALALAIPHGLISPDLTALISNGSAILASLNYPAYPSVAATMEK